MCIRDRTYSTHDASAGRNARTLANEHITVSLDDDGRIASLRRTRDGRAANGADYHGVQLPMNQLVLCRDQPRRWEAWDIDRDYAEGATRVQGTDGGRVERIAVTLSLIHISEPTRPY